MTDPIDPEDQNFEDASSQLDESLKSCRAVVSGYRALLLGKGDEPIEAGILKVSGAGEETIA